MFGNSTPFTDNGTSIRPSLACGIQPRQKHAPAWWDDLQRFEKSPVQIPWLQNWSQRANFMACMCFKFSGIFFWEGSRFSPPKKMQVSYRVFYNQIAAGLIHHCCKETESPQPSQPDPSNVLFGMFWGTYDVASSWATSLFVAPSFNPQPSRDTSTSCWWKEIRPTSW